ncbi:hypothetical protein BKA69DRAFT_1076637 [Paraphysoderma sedebokerense]|nr:hypothetical protein BKA69DRAFT_1076637 [Paraphysoderma sedebokerense]
MLEARQEVEVLVKRSDGSTFPAAVSISEPFQSSVSGGETRHVMLLRDLTETKKVMKDLSEAKAEAQLANRIKTEILYFLCHEIRNPVHAIVALAGTINSDKPIINDAAGDISVAASFLGSLVDDILALLNVKAGLFPMQTMPVDLETLLTTIEKQTRPLASERRVRLMLDGLEKLRGCKVVTDAYRLERTISKLLQHSLNSTPSNGLVSLAVQVMQSRLLSNTSTLSADKIQIRFIVTDTSAGYESSEIPHLFDPFNQRVSISCGKHFGGAGLCIALAKHFLGTLGSELHFESIKGSGNKISFQITFPLVSPQNCTGHCTSCESRMSVPRPSAFRNRSNTPSYPIDSGISTSHQLTSSDQLKADENIPDKKYRVLLVEDNVIVSKVTKKMLLKFGYEVEIAEHGQEAIDKIVQKDFSVILMDLVMPVLDGHEATLRLRAQGCNIPIIALTANALDTEFERCQKEGFDDFITKPVAGESLNTVIKSWLGHRSSHCKGEG